MGFSTAKLLDPAQSRIQLYSASRSGEMAAATADRSKFADTKIERG